MSDKTIITRKQFDALHQQLDRPGPFSLEIVLTLVGIEVEPAPVSPRALRDELARIVSREVKELVTACLGDVFTASEVMSMFDEAVNSTSVGG